MLTHDASLYYFHDDLSFFYIEGTTSTVTATTTTKTATVTTVTATTKTVTDTITTTTTLPFAPELRCAGNVNNAKLIVSNACEEDVAIVNRYALR